MFSKLWLLVLFAWSAFAVKVPESTRIDFALKMHRSFCLQSVGQSTAAATLFNDTYWKFIHVVSEIRPLFGSI